ncbi:MAG: hypothetical protein GY751_07035, partial [Bacteroidetes bacterium]|nr:hypothetical protein [Bacteroidota bacterium]
LKKVSLKWWGLTGFILALSEMTRPMALGLLPVMGLVSLYRMRSWKMAILQPSVLYLCFLFTAFPWALRQKIKHDFWGITDDTYESLFATSSPNFGSWDEWIKEKPENLGITTISGRIEYFKKEFFHNLSTQPDVYLGNVRKAYWEYLNLPVHIFLANSFKLYIAVGCFLLFLLIVRVTSYLENRNAHSLRKILLLFALQLLIAAFAINLTYRFQLVILIFTLVLIGLKAYRDRNAFAFLIVFLFSGFALSLVNETNDYRFLTMVYWLHEMTYAYFISLLILAVSKIIDPGDIWLDSNKDKLPSSLWLPRSVGLLFVSLLISYIFIHLTPTGLQTLNGFNLHHVLSEQIAETNSWVNSSRPGLIESNENNLAHVANSATLLKNDMDNHGKLWFALGIPGDNIFHFEANEVVDHTARLFKTRSYAHDVLLEDYFATAFEDGALDAYQEELVLLVNRMNIDTNYIQNEERRLTENIAIIPVDQNRKLKLQEAYIASDPEHIELLTNLKKYSISTTDSIEALPEYIQFNYFNIKLDHSKEQSLKSTSSFR